MARKRRQKQCPSCKKIHGQRGPYCCQQCFADHRDQDAINKKVSDTLKGSETAYNLNRNPDKEPLLVGGLSQRRETEFVADGDLWISSDW